MTEYVSDIGKELFSQSKLGIENCGRNIRALIKTLVVCSSDMVWLEITRNSPPDPLSLKERGIKGVSFVRLTL
jgi:hypothetical protein